MGLDAIILDLLVLEEQILNLNTLDNFKASVQGFFLQ